MLEKSADCTTKITQAKNDYINKMTDKLQNPSTAPKTCWATLSRLLYNKKFQQYHHYWSMADLFQIFVKRQIFLITFFINMYTNKKCNYFTTFLVLDKCQNNFISCY